ncbi:MAG: DNA polymerase III subunit alpha [Planctomycetes bacterium]|nr:DNA polymerase III subunit alpha [Planctomycetota bacterium]
MTDATRSAGRIAYAELHCLSNFTFLEGASHPEELVLRAKALDYAALAVTDRNTLAGAVRAHQAAKDAGLRLIIGAEITPDDGPPIVVWAPTRAAYGRLARMITVGRRQAPKGRFSLSLEQFAEHADGLLAGVPVSLAMTGEAPARWRSDALAVYADVLGGGDRCSLLAESHWGPDDARYLARCGALADRYGLPLMIAGGVLYHAPSRWPLQETLTAIRLGLTVGDAIPDRWINARRFLLPLDELQTRFGSGPYADALRRTRELAERCPFSLDELRYEYPEELAPEGRSPLEYLDELAWRGARSRYPEGIPDSVAERIRHEMALIGELRYEAYFLTVWDLVRFARGRDILCQGRGSAANSAVCYCLGITSVDPAKADLLFERFVSRERDEAPDIDVDFEHERREEVLQYIYEKYGRDRAGMTGVVITYRPRSAIRDVGKALGLSPDRVDAIAKNVEGFHHETSQTKLAERCMQAGLDPDSHTGRRFLHLVDEILGFPRHLSQHVGGMVMTRGPLCELAPIENAAMPGRTVIEWDKDDLDTLGILKVDCLSLGMLTAIHGCFDRIAEGVPGPRWTLANIPAEDPEVYDMICRADTMGVFQIESRAQMSMLPRLKPRSFYDLVIEVAIVRPGPIQGQMVHPYLRRRAGEEPVSYPNDAIRQVLEKTLGVPLFQEQAMRLAVVAAGFTPGQADQLRRAMGAWRRPGVIDRFRRKLIDGMAVRGLTAEFAERVFEQIRGFGEYGFPESHAASFALLVYVSAWLKRRYPVVFVCALINSQPMGFYAPSQLVRDLRSHGGRVLPIDVNASDWDCGLETESGDVRGFEPALRLGLRLIVGLPRAAALALVEARRDAGPFRSLDDLQRRSGLGPALLERLAKADACASFGHTRREALWQAMARRESPDARPLFARLDDEEGPTPLPPMPALDEVLADYRSTNLSLKSHPIAFYREALERLDAMRASDLAAVEHESPVSIAGLVLLRQRPGTAKGITFVTLEDETGIANLVIRQAVWERHDRISRQSPAWIVHGKLERKGDVIHVVVNRIEDMASRLS